MVLEREFFANLQFCQLQFVAGTLVEQKKSPCGFLWSIPRISHVFTTFPFITMSYVVASKIKDLLKQHGMMSAGDLADAASAVMEEMLAKAVNRAKENGRKTVRPCDL